MASQDIQSFEHHPVIENRSRTVGTIIAIDTCSMTLWGERGDQGIRGGLVQDPLGERSVFMKGDTTDEFGLSSGTNLISRTCIYLYRGPYLSFGQKCLPQTLSLYLEYGDEEQSQCLRHWPLQQYSRKIPESKKSLVAQVLDSLDLTLYQVLATASRL